MAIYEVHFILKIYVFQTYLKDFKMGFLIHLIYPIVIISNYNICMNITRCISYNRLSKDRVSQTCAVQTVKYPHTNEGIGAGGTMPIKKK